MLSLIIPTLKTPDTFLGNLKTLISNVDEVIISAADLNDPGIQSISDGKIKIIHSEKGRGTQLSNGAKAAQGDWFLFLHADTFLEEGWKDEVSGFMKNSTELAAYFKFALDDQSRDAKGLEKSVDWRCQKFGLPYGDQGLLISRKLYDEVGGFPDIPLMEDVSIVRKIGKRRLIGLKSKAVTSADKFRGNYKLRSLRNLFCLFLFYIKVPPQIIKKVYG